MYVVKLNLAFHMALPWAQHSLFSLKVMCADKNEQETFEIKL